MPSTQEMPLELMLLGWSTVLLFVHIMIQGQTVTRERGLVWNAGARDGAAAPLGKMARTRRSGARQFPGNLSDLHRAGARPCRH